MTTTECIAPRGSLATVKNEGKAPAPEDFGELAKLHRKLVFAVAFRIVRNRQVAEDVTQEAMYRGFKAWPQFRGECEPRTWLLTIATNVAVSQVGRNREFPDSIADRADETDLAGRVEKMAMSTALRGAIQQLPPNLRRPLVMFEYEGMNCGAIAKSLGILPGAVRVRLLRARRQLTHDMLDWN